MTTESAPDLHNNPGSRRIQAALRQARIYAARKLGCHLFYVFLDKLYIRFHFISRQWKEIEKAGGPKAYTKRSESTKLSSIS